MSFSRAKSIQSTPSQHTSLKTTLTTRSHLHTDIPSGLIPWGFLANNTNAFPFSSYVTIPTALIWISQQYVLQIKYQEAPLDKFH